jgi:tetratricopeptide (TPR) repeat protein
MTSKNDETIKKMTQVGILCVQKQDYPRALSEFEKIAKKVPENAIASYNHGLMLFYLQKFSESVDVLRKTIKLDPMCPEAWAAFNNSLRASEQTDTANDVMQQLFTDSITTILIPESGGEAKVVDGLAGSDPEIESATKKVRSLTRKEADFAGLWNNYVVSKMMQISTNLARGGVAEQLERHQLDKKLDDLMRSLDQIIELDPTIEQTWKNKAGIYLFKEKKRDAKKTISKGYKEGYLFSEDIPDPGRFHYWSPFFMMASAFERAEYDWRQVDRMVRKSHVLLVQKRMKESLVVAEEAVAIAPRSAWAHNALGYTLAKLGNPDGVKTLQKAHDLDYSLDVAPQLAEFYKALGENAKAEQVLRDVSLG